MSDRFLTDNRVKPGPGPRLALVLLLALFALAFLASRSPSAQISLEAPDFARIPEGDRTSENTAQFLINRERSARRAIQIGRGLFHRDFAGDKKSGCNGIPCSGRLGSATRALPHSRFESSSCATCHSTPAGSAGFGPREQNTFAFGNTIRTPDMFGAGLIEQLALEATEELKAARAEGRPLVTSNGVNYEEGLGVCDGCGVDRDLVVRPFGRKGVEARVRAFASRAAFLHLGIQAQDRFQCPEGDKDGDGRCDGAVSSGLDPDGDGVSDEMTQGALSLIEHYLINYPVPGRGRITAEVISGEEIFKSIGCAECHRPEMRVKRDPRIEHLTVFWNEEVERFEAERRLLFHTVDDGYKDPIRERAVPLAVPNRLPFTVRLYSDLKRHEMGPLMADKSDEEGVSKSVFITRPLWGVGSYTAFLHDGSAATLDEAILRHGGEAEAAKNRFAMLPARERSAVIRFLKSLVLFSVEDVLTARIVITKGDLP
ncbi:MAG TPA: di-heme oxidoredictase family protein [Blastocatellia bacterium]|nr:di-heme oxidoredictase family protein [Blastocatellia bacterium]